jgi:hypothetical protein
MEESMVRLFEVDEESGDGSPQSASTRDDRLIALEVRQAPTARNRRHVWGEWKRMIVSRHWHYLAIVTLSHAEDFRIERNDEGSCDRLVVNPVCIVQFVVSGWVVPDRVPDRNRAGWTRESVLLNGAVAHRRSRANQRSARRACQRATVDHRWTSS